MACNVFVNVYVFHVIWKMDSACARDWCGGGLCGGGLRAGHTAAIGARFAVGSSTIPTVALFACSARCVWGPAVPAFQPAPFWYVPNSDGLFAVHWRVRPFVADGFFALSGIILHPFHIVWILIIQFCVQSCAVRRAPKHD